MSRSGGSGVIVLEYTTGRMREVTRSVCSADSSAPAGMAQSPARGRLRCRGLGAERPAGVRAEPLEGRGGAGQSWRPRVLQLLVLLCSSQMSLPPGNRSVHPRAVFCSLQSGPSPQGSRCGVLCRGLRFFCGLLPESAHGKLFF